MLDYVGASGLVYSVEQRQRKHSLAYKEDGGDFNQSFIASCKKRDQFLGDLFYKYPLYKTLWKGFDDQLYNAVEAIRHLANINEQKSEKLKQEFKLAQPASMVEFRKMFKVLSERELQQA